MAHIEVQGLKKHFAIPKPSPPDRGIMGKLGEIFYREWQDIEVLKGLDFSIERGEFVGYIGANGAGKSTTLKLLTGILNPSEGCIRCAGLDPYSQRYEYTYRIGVVFGQKSILEYEVPVKASFALYREIYELERSEFVKRLEYFGEILKINEYWDIPVRKLSFGQRMRCEVAASLLHRPEIVFLDEPTIGLDASAKNEIREFLRQVNEEEKTTIVLTTHDMKDIESLCRRILMIDRGKLVYDGDHQSLRDEHLREKVLKFHLKGINKNEAYQHLRAKAISTHEENEVHSWRLPADKLNISEYIAELLQAAELDDFSLSEPELEEIVRHIYSEQESR